MAEKTYTHLGVIVGADARTKKGYRRTVLLRETKKYWIDEYMTKYSKTGFVGAGIGDWPLYHIATDSIKRLDVPIKR